MSRLPVQSRRAFLAAATSFLALPAVAGTAIGSSSGTEASSPKPGMLDRHRMMTIGGQILQSLRLPSDLADGTFMRAPYHHRVRIASSALTSVVPAEYLHARGVALGTVMAEVLLAHKGWGLRIVGHSDVTGLGFKDYIVTARLAESLKATLMSRGVDPSRIVASGAGSSEPASDFAADRLELLISV